MHIIELRGYFIKEFNDIGFYFVCIAVPLGRFFTFIVCRIRLWLTTKSKLLTKRINVSVCLYTEYIQITY